MQRERITRRQFLRRVIVGVSAAAVWRPLDSLRRERLSEGAQALSGAVPASSPRGSVSAAAPASTPLRTATPLGTPKPWTLSEHEWATVAAIAATIVPTDDDPGATEANVAGYIDRRVSVNALKRNQYAVGVRWIDQASAKQFGRGKRFVDLTMAQQTEVLQAAEATLDMRLRPVDSLWQRAFRKVQKTYDDFFGLGEEARFFRFVREDTLAGFYTNPISWNMLGYIGPPQPRGYPHYDDCPPQDRR